MQADKSLTRPDDIDLVTLGRAVWRASGWIVGLALVAGFVTFFALSMMRPVYTSEARILIENEESTFRRPAGDQSLPQVRALDEQAIESQVQVLTSRDLIVKVVKELDLINNREFGEDAGVGLIDRMLMQFGVTSEKSQLEKAASAFAENLSVYQLGKSSVIAVAYTSGDPDLAAKAANSLARAYIAWQREAKLEQTRDATAWLRSQIDALRERVAESEAAVEEFRAEEGIFAGSNNVDLTAQQLSELNSKLIVAKAQKSEAEARARMIRQMLAENGDIEATSEVLKSQLIGRLIEQRVQVQRQLAELSATLLPSHPRIQQLESELIDVRGQIRDEARKIAQSLENEAEVANARVQSLSSSLNSAKTEASGEGAAEIRLRALQREAKSNRDLLESYLARYRDASARGDVGAVPANATIVSSAHPSIDPSFPKKLPITLLVMVAVALVALAYVMSRELIRATTLRPAIQPRTFPGPKEREDFAATGSQDAPQTPERAKGEPAVSGGPEGEGAAAGHSQIRSVQEVLSRFRNDPEPKAGAERTGETLPTPAGSAQASDEDDETPLPGPANTQRAIPIAFDKGAAASEPSDDSELSPLDRYLRRRTSAAGRNADEALADRPERASDQSDADVVHSIAALKHRLAERLDGQQWPMALITPVSAAAALPETVALARSLTAADKTVVLLDIAQGASTIADHLGLKRSPGFNELLANAAAFENVLRVDSETPLQVIPSGNPRVTPPPGEMKSFMRILNALRQTYDRVLIHSDAARTKDFAASLTGELATVIAVSGDTAEQGRSRLDALPALGCPVIWYERSVGPQTAKSGRVEDRMAAT